MLESRGFAEPAEQALADAEGHRGDDDRVVTKEQQQLQEQREALSQARATANNDRSLANDLLYLYRREAARLRLSEAQAGERVAISEAGEASALARAWEVALQLAALAELKSALAQAGLEAAAEEADFAPLRDEHARHAALFRLRPAALAEEADFAADLADEQQQTAQDTAAHEQDLAEQARTDQREPGHLSRALTPR